LFLVFRVTHGHFWCLFFFCCDSSSLMRNPTWEGFPKRSIGTLKLSLPLLSFDLFSSLFSVVVGLRSCDSFLRRISFLVPFFFVGALHISPEVALPSPIGTHSFWPFIWQVSVSWSPFRKPLVLKSVTPPPQRFDHLCALRYIGCRFNYLSSGIPFFPPSTDGVLNFGLWTS